MSSPDAHSDLIKERYPAWSIWTSGIGRQWATRSGTLSPTQQQAGCVVTVQADTLDELDNALAAQERLRRRVR